MKHVRLNTNGEIALIELDMEGKKVNVLSSELLQEFKQVIGQIKADAEGAKKYKALLVVSKKSKAFVAGANIDEIKALKTKEEFDKAISEGQKIFNDLEDLPLPTIAVINGTCLGGGAELTLACDYRIASEEAKIGLPEVNLGIFPGFGGCVRAPKLLGLPTALDMILTGKNIPAPKALKMGLVDRVVHPAILDVQALKFAREVIGQNKPDKTYRPKGLMNWILDSCPGQKLVASQARKGIIKQSKGHYPSPLKALEVIVGAYKLYDREEAMAIERAGFCEVAVGAVSKNLIHVYELMESIKKQEFQAKPTEVHRMGILGAGTMGGGIAYVAADKGIDVRMKDLQYAAIARGIKAAYDLFTKRLKKKSITSYQFSQKMGLISGGLDFSGFKQMDLVVEAIVEDMEIKKKVIAETARQSRPNAILATNTSSLSVTEMATAHPNPKYFVGMHFFNPVDKMPLVEVIRGAETSEQTVATVFELSKKMGKIPVVVKDGPGFLVNRLLLPYLAEAAFLLAEGMSIETVDKAYVYEFGMPMGPFELMDAVGIDVCMKVLKIFQKAFGERIQMAPAFEKLAHTTRLGQKNKYGFYLYDEKGKRGQVDKKIYADLALPEPTNPLPISECIERGVMAMINECARALYEDKIVTRAGEVDLAMIMGTGFPPFRGGLLTYADTLGGEFILGRVMDYHKRFGVRWTPAEALRKMAGDKKGFYM